MHRTALSILSVVTLVSKLAFAQQPDPADPTPLVDKHYAYPSGIPYQVDYNTNAARGPQTGYNICNDTTQNQASECQTSMVNHLDDFCLWAPPNPDSTIGDTEAEVVAWCSRTGHGTRLIPLGALQGAQLLKTSAYIQIAGFIDQIQVDIAADDQGGQLDPHGPDGRGNPLGGLMYSNAFPSNAGNNNTFQQVIEWFNIMGGNAFCITICDPTSSSADQQSYCNFKYDRLGCNYNMPNNAKRGVFEVCDADVKTPAGVYTNHDGYTLTYTQPRTGPVDVPYTPAVPSSSNCISYQSADLYGPTPSITAAASQTPAPGGNSPAAPAETSGGNSY